MVNCTQWTNVDSSGIGEFVSSYSSITGRGGQMAVVAPSPKVGSLLHVTQLSSVVNVHYGEDEAMESLS